MTFCRLQFRTASSFESDVCCGEVEAVILTARCLLGSCCCRVLILELTFFIFFFFKRALPLGTNSPKHLDAAPGTGAGAVWPQMRWVPGAVPLPWVLAVTFPRIVCLGAGLA